MSAKVISSSHEAYHRAQERAERSDRDLASVFLVASASISAYDVKQPPDADGNTPSFGVPVTPVT